MDYSGFTVEEFVLDKYFQEWVLKPSPENILFWQLWEQDYPHKKRTLQEARAIILKMPRINYGWNEELEDSLWQNIQRETRDYQETVTEDVSHGKVIPLNSAAVLGFPDHQRHHRILNYQSIGKVVAVILLIMIAGIAGYLGMQEPMPESTITYLTKEAPLGTKSSFTLPDGTRIILNAGSSVHYPEHFTEGERFIKIGGEAFLEVAKDSLRPFRVKTGKVLTEALGTSFNVRYEQEAVEIALVEGKVQVSLMSPGKKEENLTLSPGEQVTLQNNKYLLKDIFDVNKVTAWKEGIILFEDAGEGEVIRRLERWYGVKISIKGQTSKAWNFSGRFKDKSMEYVLKSIGYTIGFEFSMKKKNVEIIYK